MILTYKILQIATKNRVMMWTSRHVYLPSQAAKSNKASWEPLLFGWSGPGLCGDSQAMEFTVSFGRIPPGYPWIMIANQSLWEPSRSYEGLLSMFFLIFWFGNYPSGRKPLRSSITGWFQAAQSGWNSDRPRLTEDSMQGHQETLAQMKP